jgi:DNA-binding transcriptional LysR family regulator
MKQNFTVRKGALDGVEAFLKVAEHRSFRRAAAVLGVTPSAVSQAMRSLEERIGVTLLSRTTRHVGLTEAGQRFLERAAPAFQELVAASQAAHEMGQQPRGLLRLSMPRAVVPLILEPKIASFGLAYPDIQVEIAASEQMVNLIEGGFDAGIRMGQFIEPDMVAVRLTPPFPYAVVASPAYFKTHARPERIEDLREHACLRLRRSNGSIAAWNFKGGDKTLELQVDGPLIAHDYPTLLAAAMQGLGIVQVPGPTVAAPIKDGRLIALLADFSLMTPGVFLYYPDRRQVLPKLRAFIDHVKLQGELPQEKRAVKSRGPRNKR